MGIFTRTALYKSSIYYIQIQFCCTTVLSVIIKRFSPQFCLLDPTVSLILSDHLVCGFTFFLLRPAEEYICYQRPPVLSLSFTLVFILVFHVNRDIQKLFFFLLKFLDLINLDILPPYNIASLFHLSTNVYMYKIISNFLKVSASSYNRNREISIKITSELKN